MAIVSFEIIFYRDILGFNLLRDEPMGQGGGKWIQPAPPG
jgi:hypothetical protein